MENHLHHDKFSPERLQLFAAGLMGLPRDEIRKAKSLYIRNAISEFRAMNESLKAFGSAQKLFGIIPIFWPMLSAQKRMMAAQRQLGLERIKNAIAVWKDDLEGEIFDLSGFESGT